MAVKVEFTNGMQLIASMSLEEMHKAFQKALDRNTTLDINTGNGSKLAVNPIQILMFREIDDAAAEEI